VKYKFNTKGEHQRLSEKEQAHIDEFMKDEPISGQVYTNGHGEERLMISYKLPIGCITKHTVWAVGFQINGSQDYHTPIATLGGKFAVVSYKDMKKDKYAEATSREWLEWLKPGFKMEPREEAKEKTPLEEYAQGMKETIAERSSSIVSPEEFDRKPTKEARWESPISRPKPLKKPSAKKKQ